MTTKAAEAQYLAEHMGQWGDKKYAVYNPHGKDVDQLPKIIGFNNGGSPGWLNGVILAESGHHLGGHICSHEGYMPHDLGVIEGSRPDRHEDFRAHYPDGYRMDFVPQSMVETDPELEAAYQRNQALRPADAEAGK